MSEQNSWLWQAYTCILLKLDSVRSFICVVFAPIIQSIYDKIKVTSNSYCAIKYKDIDSIIDCTDINNIKSNARHIRS